MRSAAAAFLLLAACAPGPLVPAALDTRNDQCAWCRMAVSERRFAAQVVAPADEPRFFDDVGCLARYLAAGRAAAGAVAWVADHRTGEWVRAESAVFTQTTLATPMASHVVAHADGASRDADPRVRGGTPAALAALVDAARTPKARR